MITKKQLCEAVVNDWRHRHEYSSDKPIEMFEMLGDGNLAVAMEYLGLVKDEEGSTEWKTYAASRNGSIISGIDEDNNPVELTFRELLSLLPQFKE